MRIIYSLATILLLSLQVSAQNFIAATYKGSKTKAQLNAQFGLPIFQYDVKYYKLTYTSNDAAGNLDTLSGLVAVPTAIDKTFPLLVYQHGTSDCKTCVPSRYGTAGGGEGDIGLVFAGMGYISLLPDYVGMGDGRGFHPYVHAATEAAAAADMLRSIQAFLIQEANNVPKSNQQIFITGYSQGGHAAMALHRSIEQDLSSEFTVTAAAHLSGPYSVSGAMRNLILSNDVYYYPAYIPNTALSYQTMYGNLYTNLTDIFKPAYAGFIQQYYNGTITLSTLNENLIQTLTTTTGASVARRMLQDSVVALIENDPQHPVNLALKDNDVYDWAPITPTRIFYCMGDDQVPFQNSIIAKDTMTANGALDLAATDVNPTADHGQCVIPAIIQTIAFFATKQSITTDIDTPIDGVLMHINISPNPTRNHFTIREIPLHSNLVISDMSGRPFFTQKNTSSASITVDTALFPNGLYLVQVVIPNGQIQTQLVVVED